MSVSASKWASAINAGDKTAKAVLLILAEAADEHGKTFLGQQSIADRCCATRETVNRAMKRLQDRGLIVRCQRRREDGYRTSDSVKLTLCEQPSHDAKSHDTKSHENRSHVTENRTSCDANRTAEPSDNRQIKDITSLAQPESKPKPRNRTPSDPEFETAYRAFPHFRGRTDKAASYREWQKLTPDDREAFGTAVSAIADDPNAIRDDHQFVPAMERWLRKAQWRDWVKPSASQPEPLATDWDARLAKFQQTGSWVPSWGEKPGREGCAAPPDVLQRYGFGARSAVIIPIQRNATDAA